MMIPEFLKKGDVIAIVAPARKISKEEIAPAEDFLRHEGFNVFYDDRLFAEEHQFAGSDKLRTQYFQDLLNHPKIKAIWCARGGYGSVRIIDKLDFSFFLKKPKWICGYSDITVFHSHLNKNYHIATLHATMPVNVHSGEEDLPANRTLIEALQGAPLHYVLPAHPLNRPQNVVAPVVGGNLSMLYSLLGSPSDLNTDGKILFIEDLDEYLYHIDRMLTNLERNGKLCHLAGLLVGQFNDMHDNTIPYGKNAEEIIAEHCDKYHFPVFFNFPAGHLSDNRALRLGTAMKCTVTENTIEIDQ